MLYSICRRTVKQRLLPFEFETEPYREYGENILEENSANILEHNSSWWAGIKEADMTTIALPDYGFYTPTEDTLCLMGDVRGKNVLEIACGRGVIL